MTLFPPKELIGYWGYTPELDLSQLGGFQKLQPVFHSSTVSGWCWSVAYVISKDTPQISEKQGESIAFVSASGNSLDAWVKVENNCLFLGRDVFGRMPLYWMKLDKVIWFASKIQFLLPLISTAKLSVPALYGYTCFSYVPTPLTPVESIFAIAAGTEQKWEDLDNFQTTSLYEWRSADEVINDEDVAIKRLQALLKNSIEKQLPDVDDVGVFLSGGLDSAVVAALLVQAGVKVKAYSLDFGCYGNSELPYAEEVANHLNIPLVKVPVTPKQIKKALPETVKALDLPFGDGVTVPLYLLCQRASQETEKVVFNGENGDQLFAGWTNKPIIAASVYNADSDLTEQYLRTFHRLYGYEERVFSAAIYQQLDKIKPQAWLQQALDDSFSDNLFDRLRRASLMLKGSQNIQPRASNLAFAHNLLVRSPFCDLALTEFTFSLPSEFFLRGATEKYILKKAVESWLPASIVWREKRGMGVPLTEWCLGELWSLVGNWLHPQKLEAEGIFISDLGMKVILGQLGGLIRGRRIGEILWLLIIWQVWRQEVLEQGSQNTYLFNPFWLPYTWWKKLADFRSL